MNQTLSSQPFGPQLEQQFGLKIRHKLNQGNAALPSGTADRLFQARQRALALHTETVGEMSLAGLGRHFSFMSNGYLRPIAAAAALIAVLVCGDYVTSLQRAAELEEVDSALLADDLPINAYLDRGFDTWLNSSARR